MRPVPFRFTDFSVESERPIIKASGRVQVLTEVASTELNATGLTNAEVLATDSVSPETKHFCGSLARRKKHWDWPAPGHFNSNFRRGLARPSPMKDIHCNSESVAIQLRQGYAVRAFCMKWVKSLCNLSQDPTHGCSINLAEMKSPFFSAKEYSGRARLDLVAILADISVLGVYPITWTRQRSIVFAAAVYPGLLEINCEY